jgi:2-hydroxychromene-2-carboxylate isomerase
LAALRVDVLVQPAGVQIVWPPFFLGLIFPAQGWTTSPFNFYPAKRRYAIRDVLRNAAARGLDFRMPEPLPPNSLAAAGVALVALEEGWRPALCQAVLRLEFGAGEGIAEVANPSRIISAQGHDSARVFSRSGHPGGKQRLKDHTPRAAAHGICGAPTFRTADGEIFRAMMACD